MKSYQIREQAKLYLTGGWKIFSITSFLYLAILILISYGPTFFGAPYILSVLIQTIFNSILTYGLTSVFWKYSQGQDIKFYDFLLLSVKNLKRALFLFFHTTIRLAFPFMLVLASTILLSGTINSFSIYQATNGETSPVLIAIFIFAIIFTIFSYIFSFIKSLSYAISTIVAIDQPNLSEKECVLESKKLMKGNRKKYFFLIASFAGWYIVGIFTLLIGFLWIFPYLQMSFITFYILLKTGELSEKKQRKKNRNARKKRT